MGLPGEDGQGNQGLLVYQLTSLQPHIAEGKQVGFVKCHDTSVELTITIKNGSSQKLPEGMDFISKVIFDASQNRACSADCTKLLCNFNDAASNTKLWC